MSALQHHITKQFQSHAKLPIISPTLSPTLALLPNHISAV